MAQLEINLSRSEETVGQVRTGVITLVSTSAIGPTGPQGPTGATGPAGPQGTARAGTYTCPDGEYLRGFAIGDGGVVTLQCAALLAPASMARR